MSTQTLQDLFHTQLCDIYYAEKQILKALPKMAECANNQELKNAFEKHREETECQIERLEQVFEIIGKEPKGKTCEAIDGIIDEGEEIMDEFEDSPALDAGLVAAAQAVEHYEMARYGTLRRWAQDLGYDDAVSLIDETLQQEEQTDADLTDLACGTINDEAMRKAA